MRNTGLALVALVNLVALSSLSAHVALDSPNGGEELEVGSTFTIEWHVVIQHNQLNWDLSYSTSGAGGPWIDIAVDLPVGDPSMGSMHSYEWTVPDDLSDQVRVRVIQDNSSVDYSDLSVDNLSIISSGSESCCMAAGNANDDELVNITDAVFLVQYIFNGGPVPACCDQADANGDALVNITDAVYLIQFIFNGGPSPLCPSPGNLEC